MTTENEMTARGESSLLMLGLWMGAVACCGVSAGVHSLGAPIMDTTTNLTTHIAWLVAMGIAVFVAWQLSAHVVEKAARAARTALESMLAIAQKAASDARDSVAEQDAYLNKLRSDCDALRAAKTAADLENLRALQYVIKGMSAASRGQTQPAAEHLHMSGGPGTFDVFTKGSADVPDTIIGPDHG